MSNSTNHMRAVVTVVIIIICRSRNKLNGTGNTVTPKSVISLLSSMYSHTSCLCTSQTLLFSLIYLVLQIVSISKILRLALLNTRFTVVVCNGTYSISQECRFVVSDVQLRKV